jgi:hypothetical protein
MTSRRSTFWGLAGVLLTLAALALLAVRLSGIDIAWWLPLALLALSVVAFGRR